nr:zinc finger MYM-type protein 1-like [Hydra vulgaris]
MSEKKRLSVKKDKESQRKAILKYFCAETHSTGTDSATESDSGVTTPAVNIPRQIETETQISILSSADYSDPANWPTHFSDNFRQFVIKNRPQKIEKYNFPQDRDEQKRKFSLIYYKRTLPNGEEISCSWLIYSVSKNKELDIRLSTEKTIAHINQQKINEKEQYWQRILERLIALVRVLAMQNLAFRGKNEKLYNNANDNFLKFVEYLALFDPLMNEHVRKIKNQKNKTAHYLGKGIQNKLIQILANAIKDNILTRVKFAKYYFIILDCTSDNSHTEQMTIIIRFIPVEKPTGGFLAKTLIEQLENFNLPIENLRGQGYDNGSNMKGKENGVQRKILGINPRAFFIPCSAHSLNLVLNDACKCSLDAISFFGVVQQIYSYFSGSPSRRQVFRSYFPDFTVKSLNDTRWESRNNALKPLRYNLGIIYDALMQIFEDPRLQTTSVGNSSQNEAKGLANSICIFKFMVALVSWFDILFEVNISNKILQNKKVDLNVATQQLNITKNKLVKMRNDEGFQRIIVDAAEIAKELETVTNFEEKHVGRRRKKRQFDYETQDEALQDPKEKFKVKFYFKIFRHCYTVYCGKV